MRKFLLQTNKGADNQKWTFLEDSKNNRIKQKKRKVQEFP